jgi:hypothetical protein
MKKIFLPLAFLLSAHIYSLEINVSATNKTVNQKAPFAEKVTIIHLNQTMQNVASKTDTSLPVKFSDLPPMENAPYMVQLTFQGVNYNKVIPPNTTGESIEVNVDVFNTSNSFQNNLQFETFIEINYFTGVLATDITYHFINSGKTTITERGGRKGVMIYVGEGKNIEAIATLDSFHGQSDIKTIKLNPIELPGKPGYYFLEQPIKPGEKFYQTRAHYKYDGSPIEITFENIYPMTTKPAVILHPENIKVSWKENPGVELKTEFNENMGANFVTLPDKPGRFTLVFSGGKPEKAPETTNKKSDQPVAVSSALPKELKIGGIILFALLTITLFFYLKTRPAWLAVFQAKNLGRLQFEMENLKKLNIPADIKSKKEEKLKKKIESLSKHLGA